MRKEKPDWRLRQKPGIPHNTPSPFLLRPWLLPLWQSEPVASRVHVVHGPKQKTLGIPSFSLAANFWRVLSSHASCEPWSVVSAALEAGAAVGVGDGVSDHCILILICTFLRASGSCLALSCRSLSSLSLPTCVAYRRSVCSLPLSLFYTLSLPLITRQLTVHIVAGYARSVCSAIRQGLV